MKRRRLAIISGLAVAFLMIMGAARGATLPDAHERAAGSTQQPSTITLAVDAHDRGAPVATVVSASSASRDAHDRGVPVTSDVLPATTTAGSSTFAWGTALAGAGAALFAAGLAVVVLLVVRRDRRLALP